MEFRRINALPPYVFAAIDSRKLAARRAGEDIIDLGFGNPDIPSPDIAVEKLCEAARNGRNHRYSASRGIPKIRLAISDLYRRKFGVDIDPETEAINTIGAKEGLSHLMWTLVQPGDVALVPSPSYPIHIYAPVLCGAEVRQVRLGPEQDFFANLQQSYEESWPRPRVIVMSFPHNPTTACVDLDFMTKVVEFAREHEVLVVHDFAYADLGFDGYEPPSILQVPGAKDVAVELYTLTKSFSMAGWRVGFLVGNAEVVAALAVHLDDLVHHLLVALERDDARDLDGLEGAVVEVGLDAGQGGDHAGVAADEPHPPARHVVRLRQREDLDADVLRPGHREEGRRLVAVEREVGVREVVDHHQAVLARELHDLHEEVALDAHGRRVVRERQDQQLGLGPGELRRFL